MRLITLVAVTLCAISLTGCRDNTVTSVRVVNRTKSNIEQVKVQFKDAAWTDKFGIIGAGKGAEITPAKPLARPQTASVRWVEEQVEHSADAEVLNELAKSHGRGTMILNIEPDHKLTVGYEQD
jgi:hypothetical protein